MIDFYGPTNPLTRRLTTKNGEPTEKRRPMGDQLKVFRISSDDDDLLRYASPVTHVTKDSPPVLIFQGRADPLVDYPQSEELVAVLKRHGVPHEFVLLEGIGHSFDLATWNKKPLPRDLRAVALAFLEKHMGASK
ncbi:MAG: alpha/beta hydrolase family protein [Opitutaceae bacterium]